MNDPTRGDIVDQQMADILGEKYLAYARLMRKFAAETDAKDVYALDRFFLLEVELSHNYPQVSGPLPSSYLVAALRNAGRYLHLPSHAEAACLP